MKFNIDAAYLLDCFCELVGVPSPSGYPKKLTPVLERYAKELGFSLTYDNKDKVLFIDARNYYTVVDKTLNEWSEWQMKNLNAIVWLYRGEVEKYQKLLQEYRAVNSSRNWAKSISVSKAVRYSCKSF